MSIDARSTASGGRPVNVAYLVVGLVFLGIAGLWALVEVGAVDSHQLGWLLPLTLVAAGAIGLAAIAARRLTRNRGGAVRLDDTIDTDVHDLEATAYAPYPRDVERTRILTEDSSDPTGSTPDGNQTTDDKGDNR